MISGLVILALAIIVVLQRLVILGLEGDNRHLRNSFTECRRKYAELDVELIECVKALVDVQPLVDPRPSRGGEPTTMVTAALRQSRTVDIATELREARRKGANE